jgi:hypothetical protein
LSPRLVPAFCEIQQFPHIHKPTGDMTKNVLSAAPSSGPTTPILTKMSFLTVMDSLYSTAGEAQDQQGLIS